MQTYAEKTIQRVSARISELAREAPEVSAALESAGTLVSVAIAVARSMLDCEILLGASVARGCGIGGPDAVRVMLLALERAAELLTDSARRLASDPRKAELEALADDLLALAHGAAMSDLLRPRSARPADVRAPPTAAPADPRASSSGPPAVAPAADPETS